MTGIRSSPLPSTPSSRARTSRSSAADPGAERERPLERWVGSVRRECLDRLLIVGRRQLEHVLHVYVCHHNSQRPHRGPRATSLRLDRRSDRPRRSPDRHHRRTSPRPPRWPDPRIRTRPGRMRSNICTPRVGTVRRECLDRLLIVSRRELERVLRVYVGHYNHRRPHRALDRNRLKCALCHRSGTTRSRRTIGSDAATCSTDSSTNTRSPPQHDD